MSNPYLPPEILDCVVDLLHNDPEGLKTCCLVSKSWVPRTRRYLFVDIKFRTASDLMAWKKAFPDSANSPAYHVRDLSIRCPEFAAAADAEEGGWIQAFSGVATLYLEYNQWLVSTRTTCLAPFLKFASTLKLLYISTVRAPCPQLFDFIRSSPLLEDVTVWGCDVSFCDCDDSFYDDENTHRLTPDLPSTPPPLTGSLKLGVDGGMEDTARRLLELPNGLHFRKLKFWWHDEEDLWWITEFVEECSHTLENLRIVCNSRCTPTGIHIYIHINGLLLPADGSGSASINLSRATRLKHVAFRYGGSQDVNWIIGAIRTITPQHGDLQRITIHLPSRLTSFSVGTNVRQAIGEGIAAQWLDLDRLLVEFWESRSIRPRLGCSKLEEKRESVEYSIGCLFPEIMERGIVDLF